jgi:hypothetical protein
MAVLAAIVDGADGSCGTCEGPLLRTWGWCPACGAEVDWGVDRGMDRHAG